MGGCCTKEDSVDPNVVLSRNIEKQKLIGHQQKLGENIDTKITVTEIKDSNNNNITQLKTEGDTNHLKYFTQESDKRLSTASVVSTTNNILRSLDTISDIPSTVDHKKIGIDRVVGLLFLGALKYEENRREITDTARSVEYIDDVIYNVKEWIIVSSNDIAIEKCESILNIVAWRLPVIDAWKLHSFDDYKLLMEREMVQDTGIWDIMTLQTFARDFLSSNHDSDAIIDKLTYISNENDDYLIDNDFMKYDSESKDYKNFLTKLTRIRDQQMQEIIIVGERSAVERCVLQIRQSEISHPTMAPFINKSDYTMDDMLIFSSGRREAHSVMIKYSCVLQNIPKKSNDSDLLKFLTEEIKAKVFLVTYFKDSETKGINANVEFADKESLLKVQKLAQSSNGLTFNKRLLTIKLPKEVQQKRRKLRRVHSGKRMF